MEKIKTLDLRYTAIKILPESIEKLVALERLSLHKYKDFHQPKHKDFLQPHLKTLYLSGCEQLQEIRKIPPNIEVFSVNDKLLTSSSIKALLKQNCYNLRKLKLSGSENLEELPDISDAVNLEVLDVSNCKKLTKIDDSVGHLAKLKVLDAEGCVKLDTFVVGGIKLVSLEILNLSRSYKLHTFPKLLVAMEKIKTLDLSDTAIKILPESIEKLVTLEALYLCSCKELEEIRGISSNIEEFFAPCCASLTSHSTRLVLTQELHENGNTLFILPGKEIPKWFHKQSTEGSVSFWVRKKFPQIALCAILKNGPPIASSIKIHINGTHKFDVKDVILPPIEIEIGIDHIILFDLRKQDKDFKIGRDLLEEELNHVEVSWDGIGVGLSFKFVECIGVYVYNYDSCMEDIVFENPSPQRGTPEEVVHRICDSDLESLSVCYDDRGDFRDWIQEDDKLNKEIIDLSTETVSNIKKKGQLMVDDVNLTLSLALPEPSNDTTSHHDDKLNKEVMDSSAKAVSSIKKKKRKLKVDNVNLTLSLALPVPSSDATGHHDLQQQQQLTSINQQFSESSEIVKEAKGKDIMVHGGNANEIKDKNAFEVTCQNWDPMIWQYRSTRQKDQSTIIDEGHDSCDPMEWEYQFTPQKDQSTIIDEGHDGCDPMEWEYQFTPLKDQSIIIDEGHDGCDPMEWEYQFTHPKDQSTIIDDKSKNQIMGPSTEVVSSARKKEINLNVDTVDGPSFSTTSETMRDLLLSDLQWQQHLSDINQQVSKSSENFKKAKGKNIIVYGDNASEEEYSNTLEKDQSTINDKGHDETESHKARVTCFDLFSYLVSLCSSSAAS